MSHAADEKLQGSAALLLASGVVVLEFAAAFSTFVAGTLLPLIEQDLSAQRQVPMLLAGGTAGMFAALPFASRIITRFAPGRVLMTGLFLTLLGRSSQRLRRLRGCSERGGFWPRWAYPLRLRLLRR